jgi:hypothetical protein
VRLIEADYNVELTIEDKDLESNEVVEVVRGTEQNLFKKTASKPRSNKNDVEILVAPPKVEATSAVLR